MGNSALGAALSIPKSALDAIKEADQKLKDIQSTAKNTAAGVTKSFKSMAVGTQPFLDALDKVIAKLNTINTSATSASSNLSNIGASAGSMSGNITQASQNIQQMVAQLSNMKGTGTSSIMQAVFAFRRLQEATKGASGMNIAELKKEIGAIDSILKDTSYNLTKADQDSLIKRKKTLQDELKYQQQMCEERVIARQKALDKMSSAEASFNAKQRKGYQEKNYKQNTSYKGALDFSAAANTLNRQARAIEYLKEARMKLSQTDADYKQKLETLNAAIARHTQNLKKAGVSSRNLAEQTSYMSGYISRWAQRMAFAFSINTVQGFVEQIAAVRGQFELSQRSLESILQNKPKADEIFNKTVELAVKSPFRIKDLVNYTRQLSAYRIESDKLYDTTKRLADVSAGLGVDMGRLILAYGQVKAAAYLRGSEVRQFTEAGVNMYGELQQYFKEVKGEAYTTAQIVDMISKRMVKFEDVEAIFQRMTDKGGMFYNMQETQANTLYGMIQKFHDAFDVMLNDIGKSSEKDLKNAVSTATELLKHWEQIANAAKATMAVVALMALYMKQMGTQKVSSLFTSVIATDATKTITTVNLLKNSLVNASKFVTMFGANLKAAFMTNLPMIGVMAAVSAVYSLVNAFVDLREAQVELGKKYYVNSGELNKIAEAYDNIGKSAKKSAKDQKNSDTAQDIQDKRKQIEELVKIAGSNGLNFDIEINVIKPENLDKTFDDLKSQYKEFINQMAVIENNRATNKTWKDHWFVPVDDFEKDAKQYSAAAANMMAHASDIDDAVAAVSGHIEEATDKTRKYYEEVKRGKKDGESELEYYERMYNLLLKIGKLDGSALFGSGSAKIARRLRDKTVFNLAGDLKVQREELNSELDDIFKTTSERLARQYGKGSNTYKLLMRAEIDSQNLDRQVADLAKRRYNAVEIPTKANKEGAEREIKTIIQDLQDYARRNKINLSVEVDDPKNLINTIQGYQKSAKDWQETIDSMERSNKKFFTGAYLDIGKSKKVGKEFWDSQTVIPKQRALQYAKQQLKSALYWNKGLGGLDPFAKSGGNTNTNTDKAVTDILQERVNLLKEMNDKYEELQDHMNDKSALSSVRQYFADSAKNVGWNADDILPDAHSVIEKLKELAKQASTVSKRGQILRVAADIQAKWDKKYNEQQLDEAKKDVEDAFSQLDLFKKLRESGLNKEQIDAMFGDLTTSFEEARKRITDTFEAKYGKDHTSEKWGDKETEEYENAIKKLDEKVAQDQVEQTQELIKAYKQQLSDQLQLDKWYFEERNKLENDPNITKDPDLKKQLQANLDAQYKKKTDENTWKDFKESDMYIAIFENLDQTSSRVLTAMRKKLNSLRGELKNLSPEQLKQIVQQMEKVDELLADRNPFKGLSNDIAEYIEFASKRARLEKDYIKSTEKESSLKDRSISQNKEVELAKQKYESAVKKHGEDSEEAEQAQDIYDIEKRKLDIILEELEAQGKISKDLAKQIRDGQAAEKMLSQKIHSIGEGFSEVANIANDMFGALNDWGLNIEMGDELQEIVGGISQIGSSLSEIDLTKPFSIIKGTVGVLGGIGKTLGGIFGWGTKDKKLQKQIEKHQKSIEKLQDAYNDLKEAMDDAFDISMLAKYNNEMVKNLKTQNAHLEAMIKAESSKKKKDKDKIEEYRKQIKENEKAIKEAEESLTEQLGGFGSKSNYKSAAEAFAQAWVDAFGEGSDALDALNNKFNEYVKNLIVKQATTRLVGKMIEPILKAVDEAVSEGSEGGNNGLEVTKSELQKIIDMWGQVGPVLDENLKNLMDTMGYKPGLNSNLSALQQGIQAVTENTAQALESLLNSMRYYLATQQADVRIIRDTLIERLGVSVGAVLQDANNNPVLVELRLQTTLLTDIRDTLSSCVKSGHSQGNKGIKVFMN